MRIRARHYATGDRLDLRCEGGLIQSVTPPSRAIPNLEADWMAPAFFDLQINGCDGIGFSSANLTIADVRRVVEVCRRHGIVELLPTIITNSSAVLVQCLATLRAARESDVALARAIAGIHLEGPYISPEDGPRGAHPRQHVRPPDWEEFLRLQEAAGGLIRLLTLAPEHDSALSFIERLTAAGVVVAIGHTAAGGPRIREAICAGARLSTHLGNGAHAVLPRHPNYIWEQLADDDLWASIICDGHHLPPSVVRCILRVKTPTRTILTCDASSLAGLPPGRYQAWGQEFDVVPEGKIVLPGTHYLAGSWAFIDQCISNVLRLGGTNVADAIDMAGARPRALLGLPPRSLDPGQPADIVLFDWKSAGEWRLRTTIAAGQAIEV
jgi:N-acetylglucosamine-6-phosphate deacetylase